MYCPHCGAANTDSASHCVACGAFFLPDSSTWQAAQRGYADLTARYARGELDAAAFQTAHVTLAVRDASGLYWLPGDDPDRPYLWNGTAWNPQAVARIPVTAVGGEAPSGPVAAGEDVRQRSAQPAARRPEQQQSPSPPPRKRHRLRGCCLGTLLVLLIVAGAVVWISPLPEQWGLRRSATEKAFGANPEPDRGVALDLEADLQAAGMDTTGLYLYMLPYQDGRTGGALYAVLDSSAGFSLPHVGTEDPVFGTLIEMADSAALAQAGVDRIAIDYLDVAGQRVVGMTAPVSAIQAFARGEISRETFFQYLEVQFDVGDLAGEVLP